MYSDGLIAEPQGADRAAVPLGDLLERNDDPAGAAGGYRRGPELADAEPLG